MCEAFCNLHACKSCRPTLPVQLFVVLVVGLLQQSDSVLLRIDNIIDTMVCIDIIDTKACV